VGGGGEAAGAGTAGSHGRRVHAMGQARKVRGGKSEMIQVENVWKRFGRGIGGHSGSHDALQGLSFTVPDGSAYALIGANGAGKTTTIKILLNMMEPTRGSATV